MAYITENGERHWRPNRRQMEFLRIPDNVLEGFYGGAAGGGKSDVLIMEPIVKDWYKNPRFKGIIFRQNFPQLEKYTIPAAKDYYEPLGAEYNASKYIFRFPSGAMIFLSYLEKDSDARKHDTAEYNYIAFDELTGFTEFQYVYMLSRCRSSSRDLPAVARSASNPGNIGHSWVRDRFVKPAAAGGVIINQKLPNGKVSKAIFIPAFLRDNPYLNEDYANTLQLLPEAERKAKLEGDWWTFSGQVFTEFRKERYPDEPPNALHVIEPFAIPHWWPKVLGGDWGYTAKTWFGLCAIAPTGRVYLYKEFVAQKESIQSWGARLQNWIQHEPNVKAYELDPSAWQNRGEEKIIAEQISSATGLIFRKADNDRLGGKLLLHDMLRYTPRPPRWTVSGMFSEETSQYILRVYGIESYKEYLRSFEPDEPENNIPRLQIFSTCEEVVNVIPLCVYSERVGHTEDVAEFNGDDPYDGLRYVLKAVDRYVQEAEFASGYYNKVEEAERLLTDGNVTGYYRRMEKLEKEATDNVIPISRSKRFSRYANVS